MVPPRLWVFLRVRTGSRWCAFKADPRSRDFTSTMTEPGPREDAIPEEEKEFQKILAEIGGREKIHLVSDVGKSKEDDDAGVLQEFLHGIFGQTSFPNGQLHSALSGNHCDIENEKPTSCKTGPATELPLTVRPKAVTNPSGEIGREKRNGTQKTVWRRDIYSTKRTIDCPVIIFIFRNTFLNCHSNLVCLKEILRDVKARTKRAKNAQPALIGLVRTSLESADSEKCAVVLENMMRSVFHRHVPDSIWIGSFIPKKEEEILEIKKNFCKVMYSSRTADYTGHRGNPLLWPLQCLLEPNRRTPRGRAKSNSTDNWQTGNPKDLEESIPLKTRNQSIGPHVVNEESAVKNS